MNVAALVSHGLATAKRLGLAGDVTFTRANPGPYVATQDERVGDAPTSFTATAAIELEKVSLGHAADAPPTGGSKPSRPRYLTVAAADCAFVPAFGQTVTLSGATYRVLGVSPTEIIGAGGLAAVAYKVQVVG